MELLYIWIEDYKNIRRQGFNFSAQYRFEFDYQLDEKGETVIGGELKVTENQNYIGNFFDEKGNITNVTAIVGENGSGKTTLMDFLKSEMSNGLTEKNCIYIAKNLSNHFIMFYYEKLSIEFNQKTPINIHKKPYFIYPPNESGGRGGIRPAGFDFEDFTYVIFYANYFDTRYERKGVRFFSSISTNHFLEEFEDEEYKEREIKQAKRFRFNELLRLVELAKKWEDFEIPFEQPKQELFEIHIDFITLFMSFESTKLLKKNNITQIVEKFYTMQYQQQADAQNSIKKFELELYGSFFTAIIGYSIDNNLDLNILANWQIDISKDFIQNVKELFKELISVNSHQVYYTDIDDFIKNILKNINKNNINKKHEISAFLTINQVQRLLKIYKKVYFINPYLDFRWREFSYGESTLLNCYARFLSIQEKVHKSYSAIEHILILIDEGELGMHPQWQKKYLQNILTVLPQIFKDKKLQFILTSHSPFLVSDLPKDHIIFLEKDKETGFCKVSDLKSHAQTFGQNIHTLFADSFFMEGGLMGEFAKEKLAKAIKWLKTENPISDSNLDELKFIIKNFGEPIVKHKLEQLYEAKFKATLEETLPEKIKRLKRELEEAEVIQQKQINNDKN